MYFLQLYLLAEILEFQTIAEFYSTDFHKNPMHMRAFSLLLLLFFFWCVCCSVQPGPKMVALAPTYTITQRTKLVNARIG